MELLNLIEFLPLSETFCKHVFFKWKSWKVFMHWAKRDLISKDLFIGLNEQHAFTEGSFECKFILLCIHNYVESRSAVLINVLYFYH